jgi:hypothetical protein
LAKGTRVIASALAEIMPEGLTVDHLENIYSSGDGLFLFGNVALPKTLPDFSEAFIFVPDGQ